MGLLGASSSSEDEGKKDGWGDKFKAYLVIEFGIWLPACWLACYRFQPTVLLMQTAWGRNGVAKTSSFIQRWVPSWHTSIKNLASKIHGAPMARATGEWALINKVLAPVNFPLKMWIAHKFVQKKEMKRRESLISAPAESKAS